MFSSALTKMLEKLKSIWLLSKGYFQSKDYTGSSYHIKFLISTLMEVYWLLSEQYVICYLIVSRK